MTAHTIETATSSDYATPARAARLRLWLARLQSLSVQTELDPHLAEDIGQTSYCVPVLPHSWTATFAETAARRRAFSNRKDDAAEVERCERDFDAPVLAASWMQAAREAAERPGWLSRVIATLSGRLRAFASNPANTMDRHIARDIGVESEAVPVKQVQFGRADYV